ncbi:hypothetical protein [Frankia sp. Cr1]|uniref:hypothetical protein n=1 Tax=Frankia sp. Cr1 TaxID=3073931 RepID=UPI002AD2C72F|nr:hypothetical protein [Frankia sp. Cr1]
MSWQEVATQLMKRHDTDPTRVRTLLEHAAVGLLARPAADTPAGQSALLVVDQAIAELDGLGIKAPRPELAASDRVHVEDVSALLARAVRMLPACAGDVDAVLTYARTSVFVREALDLLNDI